MQTIYLVRHARALERSDWAGDDRQRPLTVEGFAQAKAIAARLAKESITAIRSSPAARCVQTIEPLAARLSLPLVIDEDLFEGETIALPGAAHKSAAGLVICAHGDNIPALLQSLSIDWNERCKKGSIWKVRRAADNAVVAARYIKPPRASELDS